jgi:hypothetical protein
MTLKRIVATGIAAAAVAAILINSIIQPVAADELSKKEVAVMIGVGATLLGAIAGGPSQPFHRNHPTHDVIYDRESAWESHVERCRQRYRTYDERYDSFTGFDGNLHFCRS